jgi:hypothetical protein
MASLPCYSTNMRLRRSAFQVDWGDLLTLFCGI